MLDFVIETAGTLHIGILVLAALAYFVFFARTRFWFPMYAHFLAAIGLTVGLLCIATVPDTAPINEHGPIGKVLLVLAIPAMVYFFFVFYGGQRAAFQRQLSTTGCCPHCKEPAIIVQSDELKKSGEPVFSLQKCPHCGSNLA